MFQKNPPPVSGAGKGSAIYKGIQAIGTALGIGIAILITPAVFGWTRGPLFDHLLEAWGDKLATMLTWTVGGVEAFLIFGSVKLVFMLLAIWTTAALAARRFPGL